MIFLKKHLKKIEAIILTKNEEKVIDALRKLDLGGMSLFIGKGRGRGPRKIKPGVGRYIERYNDILEIVIVVEDSKVDQVVSTIAESAHTGTLGDGKIFISTIDEVIDITTKEKVEKNI